MDIVLLILALVLLAAGILGAFIPVIPGPPISYLGLLLMQWSGFGGFSPVFLWVWGGITVIVTVMDYFLPSLISKWFGGSRYAAVGSFLGLLIGVFLYPPWGMLGGSFLGAFAGELIHNRANGLKALTVALGSFFAFIVGTGAKLLASSMMLFYAVKAMLG